MPDLVIKPTTTSGNKLILKDQAGGAILTTADSGATAANLTLASKLRFQQEQFYRLYMQLIQFHTLTILHHGQLSHLLHLL